MLKNIRLNLKAANFPLLSSDFGRSVVVRSPEDSDYIITDAYSGYIANNEIGIPMPMYMHNVMPTSFGIQSVSYKVIVDNPSGSNLFDQAIAIIDRDEKRQLLAPSQGRDFILKNASTTWNKTGAPGPLKGGRVSKAYIQQRTFVFYERQGLYEYDAATGQLAIVNMLGLNAGSINGITSANGLLVAYDGDRAYWSNPTDVLNFTPSLTFGAGSTSVFSLNGAIVTCLPINEGFIIYTTGNAVVALWSGNIQRPFNFRSIDNSAGVLSSEHVSADSNYGSHYAWTTSGLQEISARGAQVVFPQVADYLAAGELEFYSGPKLNTIATKDAAEGLAHETAGYAQLTYGKNLFQSSNGHNFRIKVNIVGSRFLAISYGRGKNLEYILAYDFGLKRWGKLQISHSDVFELTLPDAAGPRPKESFGILSPRGDIFHVDFSSDRARQDSVFLFGRIQYNRTAVTELHEVILDCGAFDDLDLMPLTSYDGRNLVQISEPYLTYNVMGSRKYNFRNVGVNHVLQITGKFSLSTLQIAIQNGGIR